MPGNRYTLVKIIREEAVKLLSKLGGWRLTKQGWLAREYRFRDFEKALLFANKVGDVAEELGHHPNIYVYSWNRVRLELYTHSIRGLSDKDFQLAAEINRLK